MNNGPAYTKTEIRNGPPLSYVAEKLESSLKDLHATYRDVIDFCTPGLITEPLKAYHAWLISFYPDCKPIDLRDRLIGDLLDCFRHQLISFLALHNQLDLANDIDLPVKLAAVEMREFAAWCSKVVSQGSIQGALNRG